MFCLTSAAAPGRAAVAVVCLSAAVSSSLRAEPGAARDTFFAHAAPVGKELPADRVYPRGRLFPISFFSVGGDTQGEEGWESLPEEERQRAMRRVAGDGFTLFGPQYELKGRVLEDAAAHGVEAIHTISPGWKKDELKKMTPEEIETTIRELVQKALNHKHADRIAWWYLQPEELRYWRAHEIRYLEVAARVIRESDPQRRPVWMYDPGHRDARGLARTARHLDIVGKGMYTNYSGQVHERVWCRWTIEQERKAIETVRGEEGQAAARRVPIAVPEMFQHPGKFVDAYIKDEQAAIAAVARWARHDAYAALVAGAEGIVIFSLRRRERGELQLTGELHDAYYQAYAKVARELTGELGLGEVFLFGERREDVRVQVVEGPTTLTLEYRNNEPVDYPTVGHAAIAVDRDRYIVLVNSSENAVSAVVSELPYGADIPVHDLFSGRTFPLGEGEIEVNLEPLGVRAFRIEAPGAE